MAILQFKISLKGIRPKVWRRFLVSGNISFHKLHDVIQNIMGWKNYHLYSFDIDSDRIELPVEEGYLEDDAIDSRKIKISHILQKQKLVYTYDFGDSWEHELVVEKILECLPDNIGQVPFCVDGERACPPEDCGGESGYERFMTILRTGKDPYGENVKELLGWLDGWNPEKFEIGKVNRVLKTES